jgi:hypothetical protein
LALEKAWFSSEKSVGKEGYQSDQISEHEKQSQNLVYYNYHLGSPVRVGEDSSDYRSEGDTNHNQNVQADATLAEQRADSDH